MEKHPLHLKTPELQKSEEVVDAVAKQERLTGEKVPNDPNERIEAYMDRLENVFLNPDEGKRKRNIEVLRDKICDALIIKPEDFPESYFELQQRIARERGQAVETIPQNVREQMIDVAIEDQKHSLDTWINYLSSNDAVYPPWFKYYVWKNITKLSQFDKERGEFKQRAATTVAPFPEIYSEPLAQMADAYEKVKIDNKNLKDPEVQEVFSKKFPTVYAELIQKSLAAQVENKEEIKGEWVKYTQGKTGEADKLYKTLKDKGTGWCTAGRSTAREQIKSGDFYVYYTNDTQGYPSQPRLAIRMEGEGRIGEIRGILPGQGVETEMQGVLGEKLKDFGSEADRYEKKSEDMKRVTIIERKNDNGEVLTADDLTFIYEINGKIQGFGRADYDPRVGNILNKRKDKRREDVSLITGLPVDQFSVGAEEALSGNFPVHFGALVVNEKESRLLPQRVMGDVVVNSRGSVNNFPEVIDGSLALRHLESIEDVTLPRSIGGSLDLHSLKSINTPLKLEGRMSGHVSLGKLTHVESLVLPEFVGGDVDLGSLKSGQNITLPREVGGKLRLSGLTSAEGLKLPEKVGGELILGVNSLDGVELPKEVVGNLFLSFLSPNESLNLPERVGGDIYLLRFSDEDLKKAKSDYPSFSAKIKNKI